MSLKIKLISVMLVMILVVIAILSVVILNRSSGLQINAMYQYAEMLAKTHAIEIQRRIESFTGYTKILAQLLSEYETSSEAVRRSTYNNILESTIQQYEIAAGAEQINKAVIHVNEITSRTRDGINTLIKEVSRFKTE